MKEDIVRVNKEEEGRKKRHETLGDANLLLLEPDHTYTRNAIACIAFVCTP